MQVVIVAAGDGGRMGGVTKCLLTVNNKPLLQHHAEMFKKYKIMVVLGYNGNRIQSMFPYLNYVDNNIWSSSNSAHSLYLALRNLPNDDTIVFDSDLYFNFEPKEYGYYTTPLKESTLFKSPSGKWYIEDCNGIFRGIAKLSKADCQRYVEEYDKNIGGLFNKYWCNVLKDINPVLTDEKIYEFDTWGDYEKFKYGQV